MRKLVITQNMTLDGVIDMSEDWHNISGTVAAGADGQVAALQEQAAASDAFLVGQQTFIDMRGYWPNVENDETGNTARLVDEFRLFVFPAIIGHGRRLFEGSASLPALTLRDSRSFANGVVLSVYAV